MIAQREQLVVSIGSLISQILSKACSRRTFTWLRLIRGKSLTTECGRNWFVYLDYLYQIRAPEHEISDQLVAATRFSLWAEAWKLFRQRREIRVMLPRVHHVIVNCSIDKHFDENWWWGETKLSQHSYLCLFGVVFCVYSQWHRNCRQWHNSTDTEIIWMINLNAYLHTAAWIRARLLSPAAAATSRESWPVLSFIWDRRDSCGAVEFAKKIFSEESACCDGVIRLSQISAYVGVSQKRLADRSEWP